MARVSLIPLNASSSAVSADRLGSFCQPLQAAGHDVQTEMIRDGSLSLVEQAIGAIKTASGTKIIVVDLEMNYSPADLVVVADQLREGPASLVVAARRGRWFGSILRRLTGCSDPLSGLVGLTRDAARLADAAFAPVGSRFTCELLARVPGVRHEVLINPLPAPRRPWVPLDDIRHAKRIADDRLGTVSRLIQFCLVGASGMIFDLSMYAGLLALLSRTSLHERSILPVVGGNSVTLAQGLAGLISIATAIVWNFSLNRRLTFNDARRGSIARQFTRYVLSNLAGCAVSLAFRLLLPSRIPFFARHRLAAAVTGIIAATGISFSLARWFVFAQRSERSVNTTKLSVDRKLSSANLVALGSDLGPVKSAQLSASSPK